MLRIKNESELNQIKRSAGMSASIRSQLETELKACKAKQKLSCAIPPLEPADILYQLLVRKFGRYYNGGDVVWELEAINNSKLRLDAALPRYKLGIEMDGWQFHGKHLADFKKDRRKTLKILESGWIVIQVSREQVVETPERLIASIEKVMTYRFREENIKVSILNSGWSRVIYD